MGRFRKINREKKITEKKGNNVQYVLISFALICLFVFAFFLKELYSGMFENEKSGNRGKNQAEITPTPDPDAPKNLLILGYGGGIHEGGSLTDTIMLAQFRKKEKRIILISIPRDIYLPLKVAEKGDFFMRKINEAFAIGNSEKGQELRDQKYRNEDGGGTLAKEAVEFVLGIKPDYYLALDFSDFERIINILGGLNVSVPYYFEDIYYPLVGKEDELCDKSKEEIEKLTATLSGFLLEREFTCRFESILFEKGTVHMDGANALKFVRSRHSGLNDGDFGRIKRQQAVFSAFIDRILRIDILPKLPGLIEGFITAVSSDINSADILNSLSLISSFSDYEIESIGLVEENVLHQSQNELGQYILVPANDDKDYDIVRVYIEEEIARINLSD